ncbi:MAG: hydrolase [Gemmatimonadota bacterium]|nr:MAG: hydrolase [Gemmatimonadota bacterium]
MTDAHDKATDRQERRVGPFEAAWWLRGRHRQTVWNRTLRRRPRVPTTRVRWTTPDGDFLDLDFIDGPLASPQLLVIHGLEGSSDRKYVRGLLALAAGRGWRGAAINFRGCGETMNRAPRLYHSGETADLDWVVGELAKRDPGAAILPIGVSLGGNVLLKWLGEEGEHAADEVVAGVAVSTPFDLAAAAERMSRGLGRLYTHFFLRTLKEKALAKAAQYPDILDATAIRRARTWREYDDVTTAPLHGFHDAADYWERSSSINYLDRIRRPVLLISARDDPFIPESSLPVDAVERSPWLHAEFTARGGHAGFITGALPWLPVYWAEQRAMEFLASFAPSIRPTDAPSQRCSSEPAP